MMPDEIGTRGLGILTTVGHTNNPNLFNQSINLSSGTPLVIDGSGNIQWDRPLYCIALLAAPGCSLSMLDQSEVGNYENIGAAMSAESIASLQQQFKLTQQQQCAQNPEACAIAGSQTPIFTSVKAAVAQIASPIVCGPFMNPVLQPDGSYQCNFDPTNIPTWLLVAGAAIVGLVVFRGI